MASLTQLTYEFEQTLGDSEGQGSLACCSPWGCIVRHDLATKQQQSPNLSWERVIWQPTTREKNATSCAYSLPFSKGSQNQSLMLTLFYNMKDLLTQLLFIFI